MGLDDGQDQRTDPGAAPDDLHPAVRELVSDLRHLQARLERLAHLAAPDVVGEAALPSGLSRRDLELLRAAAEAYGQAYRTLERRGLLD